MAQEVFNAAGDPKMFPEMGLEPWSPLKVYGREPFARISDKGVFDHATNKYVPVRFCNYEPKRWSNETRKATGVEHEGERSSLLWRSYGQSCANGLALQHTR